MLRIQNIHFLCVLIFYRHQDFKSVYSYISILLKSSVVECRKVHYEEDNCFYLEETYFKTKIISLFGEVFLIVRCLTHHTVKSQCPLHLMWMNSSLS